MSCPKESRLCLQRQTFDPSVLDILLQCDSFMTDTCTTHTHTHTRPHTDTCPHAHTHQCSPQASQDVAACHALAKFYKDTPIPTIPWLSPPRLDLCPPRLTIYMLGKKWETSGLGSCMNRTPVVVVVVVESPKAT